jgi:hypothetical protein
MWANRDGATLKLLMIGAREHHWRNDLLKLGFGWWIYLLRVMVQIVTIDSILYGNPLNRRQFN